ncbi:hypothetical protein LTSEGIV_3861 [Salmonella enterica subsp. enterica serovar Give str. S5-487]|nr:hypothetical protein LTSEGIV_3861 [Salmonella enterica subsp. enterica serovar Give str. S5-487]
MKGKRQAYGAHHLQAGSDPDQIRQPVTLTRIRSGNPLR